MKTGQSRLIILGILLVSTLAIVGWYRFGAHSGPREVSLGVSVDDGGTNSDGTISEGLRVGFTSLPSVGVIPEGYVLLLTRLILGAVMLYYGWPKVRDLKQNSKDFVEMGFRPGWFWGTVIACNEFGGGMLLVAGVWPELVAASFGFQMMMGTLWKLKIHKPFSDYSYDLLAFSAALSIALHGGGAFSVLPFTFFGLARTEVLVLGIAIALLGAGLSRPKMR